MKAHIFKPQLYLIAMPCILESQLDEYRERAFSMLDEGEDRPITYEERVKLEFQIARSDLPQAVDAQIQRDIKNGCGLYDMLAMWLDRKDGLARWCPQQILEIARMFLDN